MKAKAWILILSIGMIGLTGFGTTADLIQDSENYDLASVERAELLCSNVDVIELKSVDNVLYDYDTHSYFKHSFISDVRDFEEMSLLEYSMCFLSTSKNRKKSIIHRKPRDGIRSN